MKIGILTHQYVKNYGAFLQCYAMQKTLEQLYPSDEICVINYINVKHYIINFLGWFRFNHRKERIGDFFQKCRVPFMFLRHEKKYLNITKKVFSKNGINKLNCDVIVIGSDEVWNYSDTKSYNELKFGYGLECKKIITYAPSVGNSNINDVPDKIKEGLKNIKYFSARDDLTEKLVEENTNKECVRVVDPTFLYKFPQYNSKVTDRLKKEKYILIYYCDNIPKEMIAQICDYAQKNRLKIYGAGESKKWFNDFPVCVNPFEWVEMFKNAELIFTGTFHGTVFSIKSNKPFYNYIGNASRNKKISSLLKEYSINCRSMELSDNFDAEMEYSNINNVINEKVNLSIDYIKNSIN